MIVIAHRGASWDAPENTLEAFELAVEQGADYVEFDVRAAPDGGLVVAHDSIGERRPHMPTLDATLEALRGRVGLAPEIKEQATAERVLASLRRHRIEPDELIVLSARIRALELVRRQWPDVRCVLHLGLRPDPAAATKFWGVGLRDRSATPRRIALARSLGLTVTVFTVNEEIRMRALAGLGVDGIISDRPSLLRATLATLAAK